MQATRSLIIGAGLGALMNMAAIGAAVAQAAAAKPQAATANDSMELASFRYYPFCARNLAFPMLAIVRIALSRPYTFIVAALLIFLSTSRRVQIWSTGFATVASSCPSLKVTTAIKARAREIVR